MAAPTKDLKREEDIQIKLYASEKQELKKMLSESNHPNMSAMVRSILFNGEIKVLTIDNELENRSALLLQQTRNIGNNFNQLIRLLHSKKLTYFTNKDVSGIRNNLVRIKECYMSIENYFNQNGR